MATENFRRWLCRVSVSSAFPFRFATRRPNFITFNNLSPPAPPFRQAFETPQLLTIQDSLWFSLLRRAHAGCGQGLEQDYAVYPISEYRKPPCICLPHCSSLGMEDLSRHHHLPAPQHVMSDGGFQNLVKRSSSPAMKVFSPVASFQIRKHSSGNNNNNQELDLNALNFDCKGPDNALAFIDDILNGELAAYDAFDGDLNKDSFAIFSCPYDIDLLANSSLSSFRLDQLNILVDERGALSKTGAFEQLKPLPGLEPDCLSDAEELLPNRTENVESIPTGGELVSYHADAPVDSHVSTEWTSPWPLMLQQRTRQCNRCEILRQIVHTNGLQATQLEIHGCEGQNYHAVMQTRFWLNDGCPPTVEQQMVEFPVGNSEYVKQFLLQYTLLRRKEGFVLQQDSLLPNAGYGIGSADRATTAVGPGCFKEAGRCPYPTFSSDPSYNSFAKEKSNLAQHKYSPDGAINDEILRVMPIRSSAAAQRERTGKLKLSDLAKHFHLPINAAAKELGICPTVLKKICRRNGMRRWPHRKIKSIERIIATLEQTIADGAGQGDEGIRKEIAMLRNERTQLCAGLMGQT